MRHLTTASSAAEAEMICSRLRSAGIVAVVEGEGMARLQAPGRRSCDVYVDERDLDGARELLNGGEGISEAELIDAEEADAAARAARGNG